MRTTPSSPAPQPRPPRPRRAKLRRAWIVAIALAAMLPAGGGGARASRSTTVTPPDPPVRDVTWRRLVFRASKLLVTATAEVELVWHQAPGVLTTLEAAPDVDPLLPSSESVAELSVTSSLLGRESTTRIWLDPLDLAALQRRQLEEGKRERFKLYRFGRGGIYSRRVRPHKDERGQALERWTDVQEETVPRETKGTVSDPSALFYWLSSIDPETLRDGRTLVVFSKSMLNPVEVRFAGTEQVRVDYLLHGVPDAEGNAVGISGAIPVYRYSLRPGAGDEDELELLGLEGDLELFVDAQRRVPIRLQGRVPPVGKVTANLKEAWLAPGSGD